MPVFLALLIFYFGSGACNSTGEKYCQDFRNKKVMDGEAYSPNPDDPCIECICLDGEAQMCVASVCSLPHDCRDVRKLMLDQCCKYVCFDRKWRSLEEAQGRRKVGNFTEFLMNLNGKTRNNPVTPSWMRPLDTGYEVGTDGYTTNYTLRLGFTTTTTILILICLLFSIHRLRGRRLRALAERAHQHNMHPDTTDSEIWHNGPPEEPYGHGFMHSDRPPPPYKESPSEVDPPPPYEDAVTAPSEVSVNVNNSSSGVQIPVIPQTVVPVTTRAPRHAGRRSGRTHVV